jgi:cell division protein FtsB
MKIFTTILVVLLILLQHRLWFGKNSWPDYLTLKQEIISHTKANEALEHKNQLQYREIADLKNGLAAIEERARNQLGLVKYNEDFFRIIEQ